MKTKVLLTVFAAALLVIVLWTSAPAEGEECTSGIRKEHLDTTPGAFVDGDTISQSAIRIGCQNSIYSV